MLRWLPAVCLLTSCAALAAEPVVIRHEPSREWLAGQKDRAEARSTRATALWKSSLIAMFAASAADMQSSVGRRELNPLLRDATGRFSARGIVLKAAITGGAAGAQWLLLRRNPGAQRYAAIANFGMAGTFTAAAVHNHTNR